MDESVKKEEMLNALLGNGEEIDYHKMYDYLSEAVVKALEMFCIEKEHSIENAIELLKNVQSKTQEIILLVNQKKQENKGYYCMLERLNLQSIGYHIKEESNLTMADRTSFLEREKSATDKLEQELQERFDEKTIKWLHSALWNYVDVLESIQFSLGMKVGARLELMLTNDYKYDF